MAVFLDRLLSIETLADLQLWMYREQKLVLQLSQAMDRIEEQLTSLLGLE